MIPYIQTPWGDIYTYTIMIVLGVLLMFSVLHLALKKSVDRRAEESFIFPRIVIAGVSGLIFSAFFDSLFKIRENGKFLLSGITFYGGLIGAAAAIYLLIKMSRHFTEYSVKEWFDILTMPFIIFHFSGRIGCFLGGCCYGRVTESFVGMIFPDNVDQGIVHQGVKRYPTQLFEAVSLLLILCIVLCVREKFITYLLTYAIFRFFIEFYRGDDRGYIIKIISPAQLISIIIVLSVGIYWLIRGRTTDKNP